MSDSDGLLREPAKRVKAANLLTGNVGLFYCCYRLSLLGWNVMPTARNARGVDILAYSQDATRYLGIQVKSLSARSAVGRGGGAAGSSIGRLMGDYWIVVNKVKSSPPSAFILLPSEVMELAGHNEKDGKVSFWLEPPAYDQDRFREKWERIGSGF